MRLLCAVKWGTQDGASSSAEPLVEHGDRGVRYDNIGELVASADAVAIGRVAATSRGRVLDQEDVVFTIMDVRVVVERLLAGRMRTRAFAIEQPGWELLGPEGLYLIDGTALADTVRSDPTVRKVEPLTLAQLEGAVGAAVAAVRRGELQPKMPSAG